MRKHLHLTTLVVLFAFITPPFVSLAHDYSGDGPAPVYQHASDCPCNECARNRGTQTGMSFLEKLTNLLPGTEQMRSAYYFAKEMFSTSQTVPYIEDPEHIPFN